MRSFSTRFSRSVYLVILPFLLVSFSSHASSQNVTKNICQTKECLSAAQNLKESIDFNANPCDDFYKYACGNWSKFHQNSNLEPQSTIRLRNNENMAEISEFLKQNNTNDEPDAVHKARKLFSTCMNKGGYSNKLEPIETILQKIGLPVRSFLSGEIKNYDYATALAKATRLAGIKMYFDLGIDPNPYNRTANMIGLKKPIIGVDPNIMPLAGNIESRKSKRATTSIDDQQFMTLVEERMCRDSTSTSCTQWNSPFNFIRDLTNEQILKQKAQILLTILKPRSTFNSSIIPVIYTLKQLQDFSDGIAVETNTTLPKLNWTRYIEEMFTGLDNVTLNLNDPTKVEIVIEELGFVKDMLQLIYKSRNTKIIEFGLWWEVVSTLLPYVDNEIFELKNNAASITNREQRCASITTASFGMAVSYLYATKDKYIKAKTEIRTMFEHIRESFQHIIEQASWMDDTTRQKALKKLQLMKSNIVYPSIIKTTSSLSDFYKDVQITDNFYDTMVSKIQNQIAKKLNTLDQINDLNKDDWFITPTLVNAYYDPSKNMFIIPAGILGLSIYNNSLHALDYGGIGSIIGHEMTHAFDNTGRRYNEIGNVENWWQTQTADMYREKAKCFVHAYGNYSTTTSGITQQADSKLTLGEDISDNAGFKESLLAYKKCIAATGEEPLLPQFENFTHNQLFTLAFANVWCENPTLLSPYIATLLSNHSPNGVRVNGVLQNSKEFAEIWKCPKGSNMNLSEDKCALW